MLYHHSSNRSLFFLLCKKSIKSSYHHHHLYRKLRLPLSSNHNHNLFQSNPSYKSLPYRVFSYSTSNRSIHSTIPKSSLLEEEEQQQQEEPLLHFNTNNHQGNNINKTSSAVNQAVHHLSNLILQYIKANNCYPSSSPDINNTNIITQDMNGDSEKIWSYYSQLPIDIKANLPSHILIPLLHIQSRVHSGSTALKRVYSICGNIETPSTQQPSTTTKHDIKTISSMNDKKIPIVDQINAQMRVFLTLSAYSKVFVLFRHLRKYHFPDKTSMKIMLEAMATYLLSSSLSSPVDSDHDAVNHKETVQENELTNQESSSNNNVEEDSSNPSSFDDDAFLNDFISENENKLMILDQYISSCISDITDSTDEASSKTTPLTSSSSSLKHVSTTFWCMGLQEHRIIMNVFAKQGNIRSTLNQIAIIENILNKTNNCSTESQQSLDIKEMKNRTIHEWNALLLCYLVANEPNKAFETIKSIEKEEHASMNTTTFIILLSYPHVVASSYPSSPLTTSTTNSTGYNASSPLPLVPLRLAVLDVIKSVVNEMRSNNIKINLDIAKKLVQLYGKYNEQVLLNQTFRDLVQDTTVEIDIDFCSHYLLALKRSSYNFQVDELLEVMEQRKIEYDIRFMCRLMVTFDRLKRHDDCGDICKKAISLTRDLHEKYQQPYFYKGLVTSVLLLKHQCLSRFDIVQSLTDKLKELNLDYPPRELYDNFFLKCYMQDMENKEIRQLYIDIVHRNSSNPSLVSQKNQQQEQANAGKEPQPLLSLGISDSIRAIMNQGNNNKIAVSTLELRMQIQKIKLKHDRVINIFENAVNKSQVTPSSKMFLYYLNSLLTRERYKEFYLGLEQAESQFLRSPDAPQLDFLRLLNRLQFLNFKRGITLASLKKRAEGDNVSYFEKMTFLETVPKTLFIYNNLLYNCFKYNKKTFALGLLKEIINNKSLELNTPFFDLAIWGFSHWYCKDVVRGLYKEALSRSSPSHNHTDDHQDSVNTPNDNNRKMASSSNNKKHRQLKLDIRFFNTYLDFCVRDKYIDAKDVEAIIQELKVRNCVPNQITLTLLAALSFRFKNYDNAVYNTLIEYAYEIQSNNPSFIRKQNVGHNRNR